MESSLFFVLFNQDQLLKNNQNHYNLEYLKFIVIFSFKELDDLATFQFHLKVKNEP